MKKAYIQPSTASKALSNNAALLTTSVSIVTGDPTVNGSTKAKRRLFDDDEEPTSSLWEE